MGGAVCQGYYPAPMWWRRCSPLRMHEVRMIYVYEDTPYWWVSWWRVGVTFECARVWLTDPVRACTKRWRWVMIPCSRVCASYVSAIIRNLKRWKSCVPVLELAPGSGTSRLGLALSVVSLAVDRATTRLRWDLWRALLAWPMEMAMNFNLPWKCSRAVTREGDIYLVVFSASFSSQPRSR